MPDPTSPPRRHFMEAAQIAAAATRKAKREAPDTFGHPEVFIVKAGDQSFTWELRRFGGVLLQRGAEVFPSQDLARVGGEAALVIWCALPDLTTFKRNIR